MYFENLPNELLIECFKYLNALDIFRSFDELNHRFHILIRSIRLFVNFSNVDILSCMEFYKKILSNAEIRKQIYSLQLSNEYTCQIHLFFSYFLFDEFPNLRSLTLIEPKVQNISQLELILPSLSQLRCFRLMNCAIQRIETLSTLARCQLRILTIPTLFSIGQLICDISLFRNLTIFSCTKKELCDILNRTSRLKYLHITSLRCQSVFHLKIDSNLMINHSIISLKQLIIEKFHGNLFELQQILQHMPNLDSLTISSTDEDFADAVQWQDMISSLLPRLNIFNLKVDLHNSNATTDTILLKKVKKFQTHFWQKEHQWYVECSISAHCASIYTSAYLSNEYTLTSHTKILREDTMKDKCQLTCFPHVTSLRFGDRLDSQSYIHFSLEKHHIDLLTELINLSNITQLHFERSSTIESSSILLEIFKQAPQISFLSIKSALLLSLLHNDELCQYMKKMIRKLNISIFSYTTSEDLFKKNKLWKTFSDIEYLMCDIQERDSIVFLLQYLRKLSHIKIRSQSISLAPKDLRFEEEACQLGIQIITDTDQTLFGTPSIWIIRHTIQKQ